MRTSLVFLFSSLQVTQLVGIKFDLIMIVIFLLFCHGSYFVPGCEVYFFGWLQYVPVNGCSTASLDFGALAGEGEHKSFYFPFIF